MKRTANTIDSHIAGKPKPVQVLLKKMRAAIQKAAPDAVETMSYGIPTFDFHGHVVHFAGYKMHIGFYPGPAAIVAFRKELTPFITSKGAVQFPLTAALPMGLIVKIVRFRVHANTEKAGGALPKISAPALRALNSAGVSTLKDLSRWSEKKLLSLHGVGPSTIPILQKALRVRGLELKS